MTAAAWSNTTVTHLRGVRQLEEHGVLDLLSRERVKGRGREENLVSGLQVLLVLNEAKNCQQSRRTYVSCSKQKARRACTGCSGGLRPSPRKQRGRSAAPQMGQNSEQTAVRSPAANGGVHVVRMFALLLP